MDVDNLLQELFEDEEDQPPISPVGGVPGLYVCKSWLPFKEQASHLLMLIPDETPLNSRVSLIRLLLAQAELSMVLETVYFRCGMSQGMHFGPLPGAFAPIAARMQGILPCELWSRQPLFDSLILNRYRPGDGITPHVDLLRFEVGCVMADCCSYRLSSGHQGSIFITQDGIAVLSLGSSAIMNFAPAASPDQGYQQPALHTQQERVQVREQAGLAWKHGSASLVEISHLATRLHVWCSC